MGEGESLRPLAEQAGGFFIGVLTLLIPIMMVL